MVRVLAASAGWIGAACVAVLLVFGMGSASAQDALKGIALVIGNGKYEHLTPLPNPEKDARAVEELLSDLGFDTTLSSDRDARRLARDLEGFVDDAEGADVAVLFYAGHGIEAGGENWLVPTDADIAALDDAAAKLVPISQVISDLRSKVGITIVLLDACRDNPFPPGALLKLPDGEVALIAAGGLAFGDGRGARPMNPKPGAAPTDESLGIVIGFSAEPGKVALDGAPDGHSPYAAALIRHLSAMAGEEFGMVLRMVGEEVYLKTRGAQRPWVNESLRRLLTFGEVPEEAEGPEATILTERRQLLLTISDLPDPERRRIQKVADEGGVPMDAIFAVLKAMGEEAPTDPATLEQALRAKAETLREMMARQQAITTSDPQIARLMELADRAIAEGALEAALEFQFEAGDLMNSQRDEIEDVQKEINDRILEFAAIDERRAETFLLAFKHRFAAEEYEFISRELETLDPARAYSLARKAIAAYIDAGRYGRGAIEQVAGYDLAADTLRYAQDNLDSAGIAEHKSELAYLLFLNGDVIRKAEQIEEARDIFTEIVPVLDVHGTVEQRIEVRRRLGALLTALGMLTDDAATLTASVATLEEALSLMTNDGAESQLAGVERALALALARLGTQNGDAAPIERAVAILETRAAGLTAEDAPLEWAATQEGLGAAKAALGALRNDPGPLHEAVEHLRAALTQRPVERMPRAHNDAIFALADALREYGSRAADQAAMREATQLFDVAIADRPSDYENRRWTDTVVARGLAFHALAAITRDAADGADAVASLNEAFFIFRREGEYAEPDLFVDNSLRIADALERLGEIDGKPSRFALAAEARQNALDVARALPDRVADLPALEAALAQAQARLVAAGPHSYEQDGMIAARFETETDSWSRHQLEEGIERLERARHDNTSTRWADAAFAFRAGLDTSFAGVSAQDRERMGRGLAESLAGVQP